MHFVTVKEQVECVLACSLSTIIEDNKSQKEQGRGEACSPSVEYNTE